MNCVTYARVSTERQAERQLSIPAQLHAMREYATSRGWVVLEEFEEAGASGRTASRPELRNLLARCREGAPRVDVVLVHKIDGLARNLADHVAIRTQLRERGVALASVTEGLEDSVAGNLVENILASMAGFYSAYLSEEVKKGMRQKASGVGWPHRPARGYRIARSDRGSAVEVDPALGPAVRRAFRWRRAASRRGTRYATRWPWMDSGRPTGGRCRSAR
jgi:site-specific DNA recombinase